MNFPKVIFRIIEENQCPYYKFGDEFALSGKALLLDHRDNRRFISTALIDIPAGKPECPILYGDLTAILIKHQSVSRIPGYVLNCSGCTGTIRLEFDRERKNAPVSPPEKRKGKEKDRGDGKENIVRILKGFSIFKMLDERHIRELLSYLQLEKFSKGNVIIRKGDPSRNLYIIVSGQVAVIDDGGVLIAKLGNGEVFGEMSLISGDPAVASVKVIDPLRVLYIRGKDFRGILNKFPSLQMYLARLLTRRLAKSNVTLSTEIRSGMIGKLSDMAPAELFQILGENKKTGILTLTLSEGPGKFYFRDGGIISAKYRNEEGKNAVFEILGETDGRFRFVPGIPPEFGAAREIGNLMWLLMEGLRRIDEKLEAAS